MKDDIEKCMIITGGTSPDEVHASCGSGGAGSFTYSEESIIKVFCPNCGTICLTTKRRVLQGGIRFTGAEGNGTSPTVDCELCSRSFRKGDLEIHFEGKMNW